MSGDEAAFPAMSPADVEELTDDQQDKQNGLKQQGADALEDGKTDVALEKFTEAIAVGCASAMLYAKRAQLLLQLDRPKAAVNDCDAALVINPDSAKAMKIRAKANLKFENWEAAHKDFQTALNMDYDEDTYETSLEVAAKVKELKESEGKARNKEEVDAHNKKNAENKAAYMEGIKANEEKFREERMKEEAEKKEKEDERKERVRKREEGEAGYNAEEGGEGVPKAHAPPEPDAAPAAGGGAEDVD